MTTRCTHKRQLILGLVGVLIIFLVSQSGHEILDFSVSKKDRDVATSLAVWESSVGVNTEKYNVTLNKATFDLHAISNDSDMAKRFAHRQKQVQAVCANRLDQRQSSLIHYHFEAIALNRLSWCVVRKVGSSFVRDAQKRFSEPLSKDNIWTGKKKLVMFVRDPYSRLMSGYLDRIVSYVPFWSTLGPYIVKNFRLQNPRLLNVCGHDVTFPEFVKYFIHSQATRQNRNQHFIPIHELCKLCHTEYDFIGHLETLADDLNYIMRSVNITLERNESDSDSDVFSLKQKSMGIFERFKEEKAKLRNCADLCWLQKKTWWAFQARGLISADLEMPPSSCRMTKEQFVQTVLNAHTKSSSIMNKREQKRKFFVDLFLQVPLKDRLKVQDILWKDFLMFEYDPQPLNIFPELANSSAH